MVEDGTATESLRKERSITRSIFPELKKREVFSEVLLFLATKEGMTFANDRARSYHLEP